MTKICTPYMFEQLYPTEPGSVRADGLPGHCCVSSYCRFRLHHHMLTESGKRFRISTIGGLIYEDSTNYENIGTDEGQKFETMIFKEKANKFGWLDFDSDELIRSYAENSVAATINHYSMMYEWMDIHK